MEQLVIREERNYGIDLFRFISMFMVVVLHVLGHGGVLESNIAGFKLYALYYLETLCIIAVNCFALISGYLNYNKKFSLKRILNLWLQVFSINAVVSILFIILKKEAFNFGVLLNIIFPILRTDYWYFTCYFMILILMPLLNIIIEKTPKSSILAVLSVVGVFIGILTLFATYFTLFDFESGYTVSWLAYLYLWGGVVRKYNLRLKFLDNKKWVYLVLYLISSVLSLAISFNVKESFNYHSVYYYTNIFNLINSVLLLMYFSGLNIKKNKVISYLSTTSFAVYLLHEQSYVRKHLIKNQFVFLAESNVFVVYGIVLLSVAVIYLCCSIIETLRQQIFKLLRINKVVDKMNIKFTKSCEVLANLIDKNDVKNENEASNKKASQ